VQALIRTLSTYVGGAMLPIRVQETCPYPFTNGKNAWASNMYSKLILIHIFMKGCHQLPKRGRLKALVWFWIIDETLVY
jgi:hypothetical protein